MTRIDEIMAAVADLGDERIMARVGRSDTDSVRKRHADLLASITQALAEARAEGESAMRDLCAIVCDTTPPHPFRPSIEAAHAIRALPLSAKREPVRLTDAEVRQIAAATLYRGSIYERVRAIEAAVLEKNGLEAAR